MKHQLFKWLSSFQLTGLIIVFVCAGTSVWAQPRVYNDATITYNIVVSTGSTETKAADLLDGAVQKVFMKGLLTRTELKSILGTTNTLYDSKTGSAVVMNEYGDQKILIRMNKQQFEERNSKYAGIQYELKADTKTILGYACKLAIAKMKDGTTFRVYYAPDLLFQNKDYGMQFQTLPGFPLEYESELGKMKVTYIAEKLTFDPVMAATFDVPKSGYREMTYEDVKRTQGKN
jgi:GLPGLI family protein